MPSVIKVLIRLISGYLFGVSLATGYRLDGRVRLPAVQDFSLLHSVQADSGTHPASFSLSGTISPGTNWQRREADHTPPSSAKVKNSGAIPPLPHMSSWHSA
jgi:hypothetical protein